MPDPSVLDSGGEIGVRIGGVLAVPTRPIRKIAAFGFAAFIFGCAAKKCGIHGCMDIDTPLFGHGPYAHPLDSIIVAEGPEAGTRCPEPFRDRCLDGVEALFAAATFSEEKDESGKRGKDTVWFVAARTAAGARVERISLTRSNPGLWTLKGSWEKIDAGVCRYSGRDAEAVGPTVIALRCDLLPAWIMD